MKRTLIILLTTLPLLLVAGPNDISDEGVGIYTDPSVANQMSSFTINKQIVSCGVGTVGATTGGFGFTGPFAMLMYAKDIRSYFADHSTKTIRVSGRMRSITVVGGATVEDVIHTFLAIAVDNKGTGKLDHFVVHFTTPFWKPGNPFCTPSTEVQGWCQFGGDLLLGDIAVAR
jgi:hypothetical protein